LAARAIENQMFFVGCNRVGASKGEVFGGHSMIVSPWGEILTEGDDRQALLVAQIDLTEIDQAREKVPVFRDRRVDVYSRWRVDRNDA
jgi:omega-amidase